MKIFFSKLNVAWEKWLEGLTGHTFLFYLGNTFTFSPPRLLQMSTNIQWDG